MLNKVQIAKAYALAAVFLASAIASVIFEFYYLLGLPLLMLVVMVMVNRPTYILYFLALSTPLSVHLIEERVSTVNLSIPTEPLIIMLFMLTVLSLLRRRSLRLPELTTALSILIIADFSWVVITSVTSSVPLISLKFVISKAWYLVVFYFLLSRVFHDQRKIKIFIWCFIASATILVLYTLYQHSLGSFSRSYAYTAMRPFLPDHGMYAALISFVVPVLFVFAVHGKVFNYSIATRLIAGGLFLLFVLAVALSFTRASWVSVVAAFGIYALLRLRFPFKGVVVMAVLGIGVLLANMDSILTDLSRNKKESDDNIENHLQSVSNVSSDPSNLERLNRWSSAFRMFEERPIMGFGPGTYTTQYGVYQLPHQMTIISTNAGTLGGIHSEYLRPMVESGAPGALLQISLVVAVFAMGFHQQLVLEGQAKFLSMAVFLGLVTYFAHGVLNNYSEFDKIAVPLYSFMAVMTALEVTRTHVKEDRSE